MCARTPSRTCGCVATTSKSRARGSRNGAANEFSLSPAIYHERSLDNMMSLKQQKMLKRFIGYRVWRLLFIIAAPLALGFNTGGAQIVPEIVNALNCGRLGEVSDIAPGDALFR